MVRLIRKIIGNVKTHGDLTGETKGIYFCKGIKVRKISLASVEF